MAVKTLVVGLGGTGCQVVARVKAMMPDNEDVRFIGFDTDLRREGDDEIEDSGFVVESDPAKDIFHWSEDTRDLTIVNTCQDMLVSDYLNSIPDAKEWFPNSNHLKARGMTKGAGQSRPLSRLAFHETILAERLGALHDAIRDLKIVNGEAITETRIMIVSSFAGGTGSGMFIQFALYVRDYIKRVYNSPVLVRGLFGLPDIFMSKSFNDEQKMSMYANAYAAIKELNAINTVCLSKEGYADDIKIKIDNLFDSSVDRSNTEKRPFDFVFFVDDVNENGTVWKSLEDYKQLMATATYMQIFAPVARTGDSREDNLTHTIIAGDGKPIYGSVGASRIAYPYQSILEYCALRATADSVNAVWTRFDKEFHRMNKINEAERYLDPSIKPLSRADMFIASMQHVIADHNPRYNFVTSALVDKGSDKNAKKAKGSGKKIKDRVDAYISEIDGFIARKLKENDEIKSASSATTFTKDSVELDQVSETVSACEDNLYAYRETIDDQVRLLRRSVVQSIIPDSFTDVAVDTDSKWFIMSLLTLKKGKVVHPLAVRMLLYTLRKKLFDKYCKCSGELKSKTQEIEDYFNKDYDGTTKEIVDTIVDVAGVTDEKWIGSRLSFKMRYLESAKQQKKNIEAYATHKMYTVMYKDLLDKLDALVEEFEMLFDKLDYVCDRLNKRAQVIEEMHTDDTSTVYVCASKKYKRRVYDSLKYSSDNTNESDIYNSIFYSLFERAIDKVNSISFFDSEDENDDDEFKENESISEMFRNTVVKHNAIDIAAKCKEILDIDVFEAIQITSKSSKGSKGSKDDVSASMRKLVTSTYNKSAPALSHDRTMHFVTLDENCVINTNNMYNLVFWGINNEVYKGISAILGTSARTVFNVGAKGTAPEIVKDKNYSKYEISCYQALYCIKLEDIHKFVEKEGHFGQFFRYYEGRIKQITTTGLEDLTPHLDTHWQNPDYLPMISSERMIDRDKKVAYAMWLAYIYRGIDRELHNGREIAFVNFSRTDDARLRAIRLEYNGEFIDVKDVYKIYRVLRNNSVITDRLLSVFEPMFKHDCVNVPGYVYLVGNKSKKATSALISRGNTERNALNILSLFVADPAASATDKEIFQSALINIVKEFCYKHDIEHRLGEFTELILNNSRFKDASKRVSFNSDIDFGFWCSKED